MELLSVVEIAAQGAIPFLQNILVLVLTVVVIVLHGCLTEVLHLWNL